MLIIDMGSSTQVLMGTEGTLAAFVPQCHHRMGCLCSVGTQVPAVQDQSHM